jgi:hypothetical protein
LAFSAGAPELARVNKLVVSLVVHGTSSEEDSDEKVEVRLKEMDESQFVELDEPCFFVNHYIDYLCPAPEVEALSGGSGGKSITYAKDVLSFLLSGVCVG